LVKKDGLPEKATEIYNSLRHDFRLVVEEKDSIGTRYTRQDLIGTPFCIAVDHQTLEDNTVTVRHRDSREQTRMAIADLRSYIGEAVSFSRIFEKL
jgi:glycyl-tRNA synthetase